MHYEKIICIDCGAFIAWGKKPETLERDKANRFMMEELQGAKLTKWEEEFLDSIGKQDKLSPKQQATLNKIYEEKTGG